ncbi:MAG: PD-(D/E)XK nuclease family protein, partial [Bacteroidia bacterium]|nr:PD-(D/E)XK nuclease family protein [Bacteroidia bacterium]
MATFIQDVIGRLKEEYDEFSDLTFVLPSKRAGLFLLKEYAGSVSTTQFAPEIWSIEEFVQELSQLRPISSTKLLFQFYQIYLDQSSIGEYDSFEKFIGWAPLLLHDFNEIDRYLVDASKLFNYLEAIQDIQHWSVGDDQTPLIKSYLSFWKSFEPLYQDLISHLLNTGRGYQGLLYREGVKNLETYIQRYPRHQHIFIGFNALNKAESTIIQELLEHGKAKVFWDIDNAFLENEKHSAGHFIRQYRSGWKYFDQNDFEWSHNHFSQEKSIKILGAPGNIGQAKHVGEIIKDLIEQKKDLNRVAVILGDESLLVPLLSSLPKEIEALNITMGLQLRFLQLSGLYDTWFSLQEEFRGRFYYKAVVKLLSHPTIYRLFDGGNFNTADNIIENIRERNIAFISVEDLITIAGENDDLIKLLFTTWGNDTVFALKQINALNYRIKDCLTLNSDANEIALESLYRYHQLFNSIELLIDEFPYIDSIKTLRSLFQELLKQENLDFKGEPLKGLQIMGMLESRVLDFDTVIMTSVNEGILPAGHREQSFIPFTLKKTYELPTYMERDAIYSYHFFRSIQRATQVFLLYNTDTDTFNSGEKSRFITQLELHGKHRIEQAVLSPEVPRLRSSERTIRKTPEIIDILKAKLAEGISPSALLQYIRNPIDFYMQYVLGIKETEQVEEVVESHTLGTVIHETLKELYQDFLGEFLIPENLKTALDKSPVLIKKYFSKYYREGDLSQGKNLIIFEIAKQYVSNFIRSEIRAV